ncbi:Nuclear Hormone Receptor family [Caenorhabditis elegans]|uniref:Nuclear Hormone Receptor family n=1 Tax=Caenorhabditis elegans TaxID=6239 RepID=Q9U1R0_CAEEL|nr:Nuclear Hormone Receptor family [Caenorhabditis elegans]CAB60441.2 Nuclear Hormone Receptor family [Caenorhabditis elegans]|eukprot:NP_507686.2 Nuclear Hormone Receptor family [Caenorhabditis elegans]
MITPFSSSPSSSTSDSQTPEITAIGFKKCAVCGLDAKGKHFGAFSCRACAAFFRRASTQSASIGPCKKSRTCNLFNGNGWFQCKKCRLERCYKVGMTMKNFQFQRDHIRSKIEIINNKLPESIEKLVGRPFFVVHCKPTLIEIHTQQNLIDCHDFVEKGRRILFEGSPTPWGSDSLQKLARGVRKLAGNYSNPKVKVIESYGMAETFAFWENDFLRAATWFSYFDDFQRMSNDVQLKILAATWHVWSRLDKLAITAMGRRMKMCCGDCVMFSHKNEYSMMDMKNMELDLTWCSRLTNQQMQFFYDTSENHITYKFAQEMMNLNPDDVELSYMLAHLVLGHAGRRFRGEIQENCEKIMEKLANNLHDYYVNVKETPRYSVRLAQILRIIRKIKEEVLQIRSKLQLAKVFDVHTMRFSHYEYFEDL